MKIIYSPQAREDLREIKIYISDVLKNPIAAKNVTEKIIKSVHRLSEQPNLGFALSEKTQRDTDYLCLLSGNHGIFYLIKESHIQIIRILDLRTDYMRIVFDEML